MDPLTKILQMQFKFTTFSLNTSYLLHSFKSNLTKNLFLKIQFPTLKNYIRIVRNILSKYGININTNTNLGEIG